MAFLRDVASFRTLSDQPPFILYVGDEDYVIVDKSVLCIRFQLLESILLVEREEFDENGDVVRTVYVRPITTDRGSQTELEEVVILPLELNHTLL